MFSDVFTNFSLEEALAKIHSATPSQIEASLEKESLSFNDFLNLLSPQATAYLTPMALRAQEETQKHFGKTIQFYVPLYLSNECENDCSYCGFSKESTIERKTLSLKEIENELIYLKKLGFQSILLLTGESSHNTGIAYIEKAVKLSRHYFDYVALEIFPLDKKEYQRLVKAGASGLTIYQETYDQKTYDLVHKKGLKKDFTWRINTPDRALRAGFRKIGLGALLGLYDWRYEALCLALHAEYVMKTYWRSDLSISFPRLRDMGRNFSIDYPVSDQNLVQMILSLRLFLPWAGLILSTRESPELRDHLIDVGITQISAESKTTPGGYKKKTTSGEQFTVADTRSLKNLKQMLIKKGYDPVLKDWSYDFVGIEQIG